ncbi:MAG: ABC transporter ATP-binding protein [Clostridium sp.]|nr:ABC transporter ATP-binding protein [Clostridium sp.]
MKETALRTEHLSKTYEVGKQKVEALKDVSLSIEKGSFVALIGTSGSGKSTLMHLLGGLDVPTSGKVYIHDICLSDCKEKQLAAARRDEIGFVFQNFSLLDELSIKENIVLPTLLASRRVDENYIHELMEQLGIADRAEHTPTQLSGGQQQRAAIARALANDPSIILCDEPTGNLDRKTSAEVMELLHKIQKTYHKTCLVVTHDKTVAEGADYILRMEDGKISRS